MYRLLWCIDTYIPGVLCLEVRPFLSVRDRSRYEFAADVPSATPIRSMTTVCTLIFNSSCSYISVQIGRYCYWCKATIFFLLP